MALKESTARPLDRFVSTARTIFLGSVVAVGLTSCAPRRADPPPTPAGATAAHAQRDSARARLGPGVVDTDRSLAGNRSAHTWNNLYALRNQARRFVRTRGRLPTGIEEFLVSGGVEYERDGWGNLIRYTLSGANFELRSAGADGEMGTADDLIATADQMPPRTWR